MKKIIMIAFLLFSINNYAQKYFEVYNLSTQTIKLADIITRAGTALPEYHSKPFGTITIPPGGTYILQNTSNVFRFPFNSPTSVPFVNVWERLNANGTITFNLASNTAWIAGNSQVFYNLKFFDGANILREAGIPNLSSLPLTISGGSEVDYAPSNPALNVFYYTIIIY